MEVHGFTNWTRRTWWKVAHDVGSVLAGIHSFTFPEQGRLDGSLNISAFPSSITGAMLGSLDFGLASGAKSDLVQSCGRR